jgi:hypothetical protein
LTSHLATDDSVRDSLARIEAEAAHLTPSSSAPSSPVTLADRHEHAINLVRVAQCRRANGRADEAFIAARHAHTLLLGLESDSADDRTRLNDIRELRAYLLTEFFDEPATAVTLLRKVSAAQPERASARESLARLEKIADSRRESSPEAEVLP